LTTWHDIVAVVITIVIVVVVTIVATIIVAVIGNDEHIATITLMGTTGTSEQTRLFCLRLLFIVAVTA